jgi:adenylate cyclase
MSNIANGELIPVGGGDAIPLVRAVLTIGRRESCDICLRMNNVSGTHCELTFCEGHWIIRDMDSTNGIKVNGVRVPKKVLHPGDTITIAKRNFTIEYTPVVGKHAMEEMMEDDMLSQGLLEKAGLVRPRRDRKPQQGPASRNIPTFHGDDDDDLADDDDDD